MSSAIGNILGSIAQQVGPEGAAKAALLAQQTQGADLDNQDTWKSSCGREPGHSGADAHAWHQRDRPRQSGRGGHRDLLAQPPSATPGPGGRLATIPDESGYTPEQKYLLNEAMHGGLGAEALGKDVDTFSTPLVGAGNTPGAIRTRATTPLSPGQVDQHHRRAWRSDDQRRFGLRRGRRENRERVEPAGGRARHQPRRGRKR